MNTPTLSDAQRNNLSTLASYLERLPSNYKHFDMETFAYSEEHEEVPTSEIQNGKFSCGTVACAVGHGPAAGITFCPSDLEPNGYPGWLKYSERFVPSGSPEWIWCFSDEWAEFDNTPRGAAARIRHLLAGKRILRPCKDALNLLEREGCDG